MASPRITHGLRERVVLTDLEASFPNFRGHTLLWTEVPEGQDPPDFISRAVAPSLPLSSGSPRHAAVLRQAAARQQQALHIPS